MKRLITPECSLSLVDLIKTSKRFHQSVETNVSTTESDGIFIENECNETLNTISSVTNFVFSKSKTPSFCTIIQPEEVIETESNDNNIRKTEDLRTGISFNIASNHYNKSIKLHQERPIRIISIFNHLSNNTSLRNRFALFMETLDMRNDIEVFLNDDDYLRVHLPGYVQRLDKISKCKCQIKLNEQAEQYTSIYFTESSIKESKTAASTLCNLVSKVIKNELDNGFAIIRPPGHHAEPSMAGGFCIINNVAVAAAYAREKLGVGKILIVDWDVHHGNGTQKIFSKDPNILYFSVHRYHNGNYYPHKRNASPNTVGEDRGKGYTINVAWNKKGMGDKEYLAVWKTILMPVATEYKPDLVLVSAGFDAALGDVGECNVTPQCFGVLTKYLLTIADGKVVCTLEGGYVKSVLNTCVESVCVSLLEGASNKHYCLDEFFNELDNVDSSAVESIRKTISVHSKYWSCLKKVYS